MAAKSAELCAILSHMATGEADFPAAPPVPRDDIILAALAPAGGQEHSPVQVQKLLFLLDREVPHFVGKHFDFVPYNYGPFDPEVYRALDILGGQGLVSISRVDNRNAYALTPAGQRRGEEILSSLPAGARHYIRRVSKFVMDLTFVQLISAIYKAYPEMRANSVFRSA